MVLQTATKDEEACLGKVASGSAEPLLLEYLMKRSHAGNMLSEYCYPYLY